MILHTMIRKFLMKTVRTIRGGCCYPMMLLIAGGLADCCKDDESTSV